MEKLSSVPDPIQLAEAEVASARPTHVLFALIATVTAMVAIVPIYNNLIGPDAWRHMVANGQDQLNRFFHEMTVAGALGGVLVAWLTAVYSYRRSLRGALRRCAPKGRKPSGLGDGIAFAAEEVQAELRSFENLPLGPVYAVLNERSTESFVLGSNSRSWLVLSISHLMLPVEQLRFIIRHECAHLRMGDHKIIQWIPALVRGQILAYLLCTVPLTFIALSRTELSWRERSTYMFENFIFGVITVAMLFIAAEILKQREVDADVSAAAVPGAATGALDEAVRRSGDSFRNLAEILLGHLYHPKPAQRLARLTSARDYLAPQLLLPVLGGFLLALVGNWGYNGVEYPAFIHYWPRALMALVMASAVALDVLRSAGPGFQPLRAAGPAFLRFVGGLACFSPFDILRGTFAGTEAVRIIGSSIEGMMDLMMSACQFGFSLWVTLIAARRCLRAIPRGFPARRLSMITLLPAAGFFAFQILTGLIDYLSGWDLYSVLWVPAMLAIPLMTLLLVGQYLASFEVCPRCGKRTGLDLWHVHACPACGVSWGANRREAAGPKWREIVRLALPSIGGGMFGGMFVALIPTVLVLYTIPAEALSNAYPRVVAVSMILGSLGGIVGAMAFAVIEFPASRRPLALAALLLAAVLLIVRPPDTNQLLPITAVLGGLYLSDRLSRSHSWAATLRGRIAICVLCNVALWAAASYPIDLLSAARGWKVGVWRDVPAAGETNAPVSPFLESIRNLTDSLVISFVLAQGIVTFQAVFGRRREPTRCITQLDAEALMV